MGKYGTVYIAVIVIFLLGIFVYKSKTNSNEQPSQVAGKSENQVSQQTSTPSSQSAKQTMEQPELTINKNSNYTATLKTTEGNVVIELTASKTPITVNNFVSLANKKFYDNTIFHRVIDGFMIQGGDPQGTGAGGPGYTFADEPFEGEYTKGTVAMANAGPDTNGSQFFIIHKDYPLPKNYVIFGKVIEGIEIVDKIATAPVTQALGGEMSKPQNPVHITTVLIEEKN